MRTEEVAADGGRGAGSGERCYFPFGFFFGPGFNDGQLNESDPTRKALGSHVLFREAMELGYRINPVWTISAYVDHISNGGLAKYNQSINNVGGRIGMRF